MRCNRNRQLFIENNLISVVIARNNTTRGVLKKVFACSVSLFEYRNMYVYSSIEIRYVVDLEKQKQFYELDRNALARIIKY